MNSKKLLLAFFISLSISSFAQRPDLSMIPYRKGDLWGYATPEKRIIIKPAYEETNFFYEGFASVRKGTKYGYLNKAGNQVIPFQFFSAKRFRYGYTDNAKTHGTDTVLFAGAVLSTNDIERCIDTRGKRMTKCPAINEDNAVLNIKPMIVDSAVSSFSTLNKSETFDKVTAQYKLGGEETYYVAIKDNMYGVINNKFQKLVPFDYTNIEKLVIDNIPYLIATKGDVKGILNGDGFPIVEVENSRLDQVKASDGKDYFIVTKKGKTGLRNFTFQDLVDPVYSDIQYDAGGGFILTSKDNLKGAWFYNGKRLEPKYAGIQFIANGNFVFIKSTDGKSGYINKDGVEFFED